jgi:Starch-binding associating with outer membrane
VTANREHLAMNRIRISRSLVASAAVVAAACSTDLTGININPNNPTSAPPSALFTTAIGDGVSLLNSSFVTLSMTSLFAQHIAQVQYVEEDRGHVRPENINFLNATIYSGALEDLQKVKVSGVAAGAPGVWGPASVMQTWVFQNLTDLWGDIPYSQALQGDSLGGSLAPAYDAQKDIYSGMLKALTDASAGMKSAPSRGAGLGSGDIIYGGDLAKWQRFSNTLRARMALRMLKNDRSKAIAELTAALTAGLMASNDDNAAVSWPGDGIFDNPLSRNFATRDDHRVSKTLLDTLISLDDPRIPVFAQPTKADPSQYVGLQNGLDNVTVAPFFNTTSRPGTIFYPGATVYGTFGTPAGKSTPSYLATYAEAEFILAEAAEQGIAGASDAAAHYRDAVTASIEQWGGSTAEAAAYLAQPGVAYAGGAEGLRQIGLQKWIAFYTQGMEAWSEWRRTGNPSTIRMGPQAFSDVQQVPRRIPYPSDEQSVNATNLAAAIARQGADTYLTRVWWDK